MPGFFVCLRRTVCPTPTCVGNTSIPRIPVCARPVHPHVRGEYFGLEDKFIAFFGSSPRAWGILQQVLRWPKVLRFIPTCVGNTQGQRRKNSCRPVHPHVRGEYQNKLPMRVLLGGSSPRAWGIRYKELEAIASFRFIPTCVGNTVRRHPFHRSGAVHPHVRGEYSSFPQATLQPFGSSPRPWGIRSDGRRERRLKRFIPTCVGNTRRVPSPVPFPSVHPHVRGEYIRRRGNQSRSAGSSPRAWGIQAPEIVKAIEIRFIPTCVGNTRRVPSPVPFPSVHPHVRGEYIRRRGNQSRSAGSSPRAWGIQAPEIVKAIEIRFIPTCVGNTICRW